MGKRKQNYLNSLYSLKTKDVADNKKGFIEQLNSLRRLRDTIELIRPLI